MSELVEVKTIGEVERIVLASGQWDGTGAVEFSSDGRSWAESWTPTDEKPRPEFARVEVYRKDVRMPTRVTIRWAEQFPEASDEWAAKWTHSPMRHFGRTARMVAYRQAFRDLLGDMTIEDEAEAPEPVAAPEQIARDWQAEITAADTVAALDEVVRDARKARVFRPDAEGTALDRLWKQCRRDMIAAEATPEPDFVPTPAKPAPTPAQIAKTAAPVPADRSPKNSGRPPAPKRPSREGRRVQDRLEDDIARALQQLSVEQGKTGRRPQKSKQRRG